jgi:hypothetical protein
MPTYCASLYVVYSVCTGVLKLNTFFVSCFVRLYKNKKLRDFHLISFHRLKTDHFQGKLSLNFFKKLFRIVCFELHKQCNTIRMLWMRSLSFNEIIGMNFSKKDQSIYNIFDPSHFSIDNIFFNEIFSWRQASSFYIGSKFTNRVHSHAPSIFGPIERQN